MMRFRTCSAVMPIVWVMFCSALVLRTAISNTTNYTDFQEMMRRSWNETRFPVDKDSRKSNEFLQTVYNRSLNNAPDDISPRGDFPTMDGRSELRAMSKIDREQFREALNLMKTTQAVSGSLAISEYDLIVSKHEVTQAQNAHYGCAFPLWHRIYLQGFERALQNHRPGLMLPYFDSRLDFRLPEPSDSVIWFEELIGTNNGHVTTGLGAGWQVYPETCKIDNDDRLQRGVVPDTGHLLYGNDLRQTFIETPASYKDFMTPYDGSNFERNHSMVHVFMGGHMVMLSCSPNDPVFWMHHCFIDHCLDELLRKPDFDKTYPVGPDIYGTPVPLPHRMGAPLSPFVGYNITDVWHEQFMDIDYYYNRSPGDIQCTKDSQCGSEFLWCDPPQCVSKVRNGGFCGTFPARCCYCADGQTAHKDASGICSCKRRKLGN